MNRPSVLQLCPLSPALEQRLGDLFAVIRYFELADAAEWIGQHGSSVRAIVTGGHIGTPNELVMRLPALEIISVNGVGVDKIDLDVTSARGIVVATTVGVLDEDVADLALGLVITLLRGIVPADQHVRAGDWPGSERPLTRKVSGRRFGVVGLGGIGTAIADRLAVLGPVAWHGPREKPSPYRYVANLLQLAREVDVLVLACSANPANRNMVDAEVLAALGTKGVLINVARGSLVDEDALIDSLVTGTLSGAGLDVFAHEPHVPAALSTLPNVVLTPHIASATQETRQRMADMVVDSLRRHFAMESA